MNMYRTMICFKTLNFFGAFEMFDTYFDRTMN